MSSPAAPTLALPSRDRLARCRERGEQKRRRLFLASNVSPQPGQVRRYCAPTEAPAGAGPVCSRNRLLVRWGCLGELAAGHPRRGSAGMPEQHQRCHEGKGIEPGADHRWRRPLISAHTIEVLMFSSPQATALASRRSSAAKPGRHNSCFAISASKVRSLASSRSTSGGREPGRGLPIVMPAPTATHVGRTGRARPRPRAALDEAPDRGARIGPAMAL
jgi:hypothetical protein